MFAFVPFFLKDNLVRGRDVERFTIHFGLRDVPLRGQPRGNRMSRKQRPDVTRRAIVAIHREHALWQRELTDIAGTGEEWRQTRVSFDPFVVRLLVQKLPF